MPRPATPILKGALVMLLNCFVSNSFRTRCGGSGHDNSFEEGQLLERVGSGRPRAHLPGDGRKV
ncbi:MAG: hypothetical protein AAFW88_07155, partial [Pseudomonadota bacterium]